MLTFQYILIWICSWGEGHIIINTLENLGKNRIPGKPLRSSCRYHHLPPPLPPSYLSNPFALNACVFPSSLHCFLSHNVRKSNGSPDDVCMHVYTMIFVKRKEFSVLQFHLIFFFNSSFLGIAKSNFRLPHIINCIWGYFFVLRSDESLNSFEREWADNCYSGDTR